MRRGLLLLLTVFMGIGVYAQDDLINKVKDNGGEDGFNFEIEINLDATEVKDQGSSGTCWSYCSTSFIESEMIRMGKEPVDISEMYTVRMCYQDKADKYVRLHGLTNFSQGGAIADAFYVIKKYGAVPQEAYTGLVLGEERNRHGEMETVMKNILDGVLKNKNGTLSPAWRATIDASLDAYLGDYPGEFTYEGKSYTPKSFADEVVGINPDDYLQFCSYTHNPFDEEMVICVPDNWTWSKAWNVPLDEMMEIIDDALENGYTIDWAADVSEKGFSLKNGVAVIPAKDWKSMTEEEKETAFDGPKPELQVTQEIRQEQYDNFETTDDHGMHITGIARDQEGNKFYIVKNSWSTKYGFDGYIYFSEQYVRLKTIGLMLHKDEIKKETKKRLDL